MLKVPRSFRHLGAHLVAVVCAGVSFAHVARLIFEFSWRDMPLFAFFAWRAWTLRFKASGAG